MEYKDNAPYHPQFKAKLEEIFPGLSADLSLAATLPEEAAMGLLRYVLELGCQCQNSMNLQLGQDALLELPREWVLARVEKAAEAQLDPRDDWDYANLMRLAEMLDPALVARLAERGLASSSPWIVEIAGDYVDGGS